MAILVDWSTYHPERYWQDILSYLGNFVEQLGISPNSNGNHVSLIGYSSAARVVFSFKDSQNVNEIQRRIKGLDRHVGYRRPDEALKLAGSDIFTQAGGVRDVARKVRNN